MMVPHVAPAQACGGLTETQANAVVTTLGPLFYDEELADARGTEIQQLDPAVHPGTVVREDSVCHALAERMLTLQRQGNLRWQDEQEPEYTIAILRFGPYYVGMIREKILPEPGALMPSTGRGAKMIFRVSDLEFLLGVV